MSKSCNILAIFILNKTLYKDNKNMYENLTYPVFVVKKFEQITYSQVDEYKDGEVFEYNPIDQVHIALNEHGFFKQIPNSECIFRAQRELTFGENEFRTDDLIKFEQMPESRIEDLYLAGFIKKIYLGDIQKKKEPTQKVTKVSKEKPKKVKKNSYAKIAKELKLTPKKFKTLYFEKFNKEIKDMKHTVSKPTEKKIIEALS